MRLKIVVEHPSNVILPWDYQYALQHWIYNTLSKADSDLSSRLHSEGFRYDGRIYKLFCFGPWQSFPYKAGTGGLKFFSGSSEIMVSFLLPDILAAFVAGLFRDQEHVFYFWGRQSIPVSVKTVELLPSPFFSDGSMSYRLITGARISIREPDKENPQYIGPGHEEYPKKFIDNLFHKYYAASREQNGEELIGANAKLNILSDYKTQKINVPKGDRPVEMIGYRFDFELTAPADIHKVLYFGGAGEACSMGMGWVERLENDKIENKKL